MQRCAYSELIALIALVKILQCRKDEMNERDVIALGAITVTLLAGYVMNCFLWTQMLQTPVICACCHFIPIA